MTAEAAKATARRLAWSCRRGLLELDLVLAPLAARLERGEQVAEAEQLLACDDAKIYNVLVTGTVSPEPSYAELAAELKSPDVLNTVSRSPV